MDLDARLQLEGGAIDIVAACSDGVVRLLAFRPGSPNSSSSLSVCYEYDQHSHHAIQKVIFLGCQTKVMFTSTDGKVR